MRPLNNNFTTPDQSKLLLELGVPADSADCLLSQVVSNNGENWWDKEILAEGEHFCNGYYDTKTQDEFLPCWSVGRLIEIIDLCYNPPFKQVHYIKEKDCNIDYLITVVGLIANSMDYSKLEEE